MKTKLAIIVGVLTLPLVISCSDGNQMLESNNAGDITALVPTGAAGEAIAPPVADSADPLGLEPGFDSSKTIDQLPMEFSERASSDLKQMKTVGHIKVPDEVVDGFNIKEYSRILGGEKAKKMPEKSVVALYSIEGTPFIDMKFHGAKATSINQAGLVTGVTRIFSLDDETMLSLEEWDYLKSDGSVVMHPEFINESVHGLPAISTISINSKGKAISELTWEKDGKLNTLIMTGYITGRGEESELVTYAESLY